MYKVEFSYPMGIWTGGSVWCGHCWTFEDAVEVVFDVVCVLDEVAVPEEIGAFSETP